MMSILWIFRRLNSITLYLSRKAITLCIDSLSLLRIWNLKEIVRLEVNLILRSTVPSSTLIPPMEWRALAQVQWWSRKMMRKLSSRLRLNLNRSPFNVILRTSLDARSRVPSFKIKEWMEPFLWSSNKNWSPCHSYYQASLTQLRCRSKFNSHLKSSATSNSILEKISIMKIRSLSLPRMRTTNWGRGSRVSWLTPR